MEKVEKWMLTCDEERWLEEYNMVGNFLQAIKDNYLTAILIININYRIEHSGSKPILSQQRCSQKS